MSNEKLIDPIVRHLEPETLGAATGRRYQIKVRDLDPESQRELYRLIRDLKMERDQAKSDVRRNPWKYMR